MKSKLGYFSLGKISTDIISPVTLKPLLLKIHDNTPGLISLIADPKRQLWSFYKYFTCSTYVMDGKVIKFKFKHIYFTSIEKQVLTTYTNLSRFASWELHQYSRRMCGPMKNPKVETRSRDSNLGPHDCKADALPHDHGHHSKVK